jgi:hypothetical protein
LPQEEAPDATVAADLVGCFTRFEFCKPFVDLRTQVAAMHNVIAPRTQGVFSKDTGRFVPPMPKADENRRQIPSNRGY